MFLPALGYPTSSLDKSLLNGIVLACHLVSPRLMRIVRALLLHISIILGPLSQFPMSSEGKNLELRLILYLGNVLKVEWMSRLLILQTEFLVGRPPLSLKHLLPSRLKSRDWSRTPPLTERSLRTDLRMTRLTHISRTSSAPLPHTPILMRITLLIGRPPNPSPQDSRKKMTITPSQQTSLKFQTLYILMLSFLARGKFLMIRCKPPPLILATHLKLMSQHSQQVLKCLHLNWSLLCLPPCRCLISLLQL